MNKEASQPLDRLNPLKYHDDLVSFLSQDERAVWEWTLSADTRAQQVADMRDSMLRNTYRLEPESHPEIYATAHNAMARLGIDAPATLYQAGDGAMNASLCFISGEVHLIFYGPILEKLSAAELLALMGHELAHYRLWMANSGAYYNASRMLDHALSYSEAKPAHRETARLLSLHTELYADRGAAVVCGDVAPAISVLVKTMTGLGSVDPAAYLRQAEELETASERSTGVSHPEIFIRARALDQWWREVDGVEEWIAQRLCGPISIESLDLLRQSELTKLTRGFFVRLLREVDVQSEEVLTQIRRYFPRLTDSEQPLDLDAIGEGKIDDATRRYFIALMFDCAMADPDARETVMLANAKIAKTIGASDLFAAALKRDLKWTKAATDKLFASAAKAA